MNKNLTSLPSRSAWSTGSSQSNPTTSPISRRPAPSDESHRSCFRGSSSSIHADLAEDGFIVFEGTSRQGSIDASSASISSPTLAVSVVKSPEGVKFFGTVPAGEWVQQEAPMNRNEWLLSRVEELKVPRTYQALATARAISDIGSVAYPEGVSPPDPELNQNAKEGKFRYNRDFLLQFIGICKDLKPLHDTGLGPLDPLSLHSMCDGSGHHCTSAALPAAQQATVGLQVSSSISGIGVTEVKNRQIRPVGIEQKVKSLLNKLTMENFDSISDQIIWLANKSEKEKDARTMVQVIRLVFEGITDEPPVVSEVFARLCRRMMEQISPKVQDHGIKNNEGEPITGGQLFRKYVLNRCQEGFEKGWLAKKTTAATKANEVVKAANETKGNRKEECVLYSDDSYAAHKAKRRGLGLIKFIGELFKLQILTERIMHECVKKFLGNVDSPEEEEIESLCKLLTTVGGILDTQKARAHMDAYFSRMQRLVQSLHVTPRMKFMLLDVIELRERKWVARQSHSISASISQAHEAIVNEKVAQGKKAYQRQVGPEDWIVTGSNGRARPSKAGDLSNFGKISKGRPLTFGPGSVFAGKNENKKGTVPSSKLSSQNEKISDSTAKPAEPQRKRLVLQPRCKPLQLTEPEAASSDSEDDEPTSVLAEMSEESALKNIDEDAKEFWVVRNIHEDAYFADLPPKFHAKMVEKLVGRAVEAKVADAELLAQFFGHLSSKGLCSPSAFEEGFTAVAEFIDDIIYDAPKALELFAIVLKGAGLGQSRQSNIARKSSENNDKLLGLF